MKRPKERPSQTVARLPPRVASPGGTHVVMRLEELTLYPTCIRFRVALAQARRNLYLNSNPVMYSPPDSGSGLGRYDSGVASAWLKKISPLFSKVNSGVY